MPPKKKSKTEKSKKKSQSQKQRQSITVNINQSKSRPRRRAQSRYSVGGGSVGGGSVSGVPATVIQATPSSSTIEGLQFRLDNQKKLIEDQRNAMKDFRDRVDETYQNQQQTRLLEPQGFETMNTPMSYSYFEKSPSVDGSERSIPRGLVDEPNRSDYGSDQSISLQEMTDRFKSQGEQLKSVEQERNEAIEREKELKKKFDVNEGLMKQISDERAEEKEKREVAELTVKTLRDESTEETKRSIKELETKFQEQEKDITRRIRKKAQEKISKAIEEEKELSSKTLEQERERIRAEEKSLATKSIEDFKKQNKATKFKGLDKATGYGSKEMGNQSVGAGQLFETIKTKGRPPEFDATKSGSGSLEFERKFKISGQTDLPSFYESTTRDYGQDKGRGVIARARDINAPLKKVNVPSGENLERASGGGLPAEEPDAI